MRSAKAKNFFREIKNNKGRFLSIFFIVLLGTAFFAGIRSTSGDMKYTADRFYRETSLMDMRVLSTLGITEEDIEDLQAADEVDIAEGAYTADVLAEQGDELKVIKVIGETEKINLPYLTEGRRPEKKNECIADFALVKELGYKIGDKVVVRSGTEDDISDTLNETEFTITGIGSLPYYIDLTRGSSSVGDGNVKGFIMVLPEAFETDVFSEGYLKIKGTEGMYAFSEEYDDTVEATEDHLEELLEEFGERRYDNIVTDAQEEIDEHKQEIADGEKELADAKDELDENEVKLNDSEKELKDAKKELEDAEKELGDAKSELEDGKKKIADAEKEILDSEEEIANGWQEYHDGKAELEAGREKLGEGWQQYYEGQETLAASEEQLKAGRAELEGAKAELEANEAALQEQKAAYEEGEAQYAAGMAALEMDPGNEVLRAQMEALRAQLDAAAPQIAAAEQQLAGYRQVLTEKEAELSAGEAQLEQGKAEAAAAYQTLSEQQAQFEASEKQLQDAYNELAEGQSKLEEGKAELEEKKQELLDGEKEYKDGVKDYDEGVLEYEDGLKEYEDGRAEWQDGYDEYNEKYPDAIEDIEEGKQKLADAEEELAELEHPDTYVLDRQKVSSLVSFEGDADRIDHLSNVFPVIFFLVAALVSLTAMTRMVEEQRMEIGTMKALGSSDASVAFKYILYASFASLGGGIIGVFVGQKILPAVILDAYHTLYTGIPVGDYPFNAFWAVIAIIIATGCTVVATILACRKVLADKPAVLMRPEAPKSGKRVIFEHMKWFWSRINFSKKATIRNLFRYKKRFFMTVIGIGGCMALMLVGYGIQDSITGIAKLQYTDIFKEDVKITINDQASDSERDDLISLVNSYDGIKEYMEIAEDAVTLNSNVNDRDRSAYLFVPKYPEKASDYVRLKDRQEDIYYEIPEEGAIITEKAADMLGIGKGDQVLIKLTDESEPKAVTISDVVENYVLHYVYMTPETYKEVFGEEPEFNELFVKYDEPKDEAYESRFGEALISSDACSTVEFTTELRDRIDKMLESLDMVMWVLILASAFLAFVVLYNLNSINITERKRELATLKVLGFHDMEVAMYIYRENIILTAIGIVAGIILGIVLHRFVITTVEVDLMMFGRVIKPSSFLICALWTAAFSIGVNLIMFWHFRKIDMIESLKSVE